MTDHVTSETAARGKQQAGDFSLGAWTRANALGLGAAYGLFALFGDTADALGARHGVFHGIAAISGLLIGGALFVVMRRRVLAPHLDRSTWTAIAAGIGLAVGFIVGFGIAGPPFDFILGVITLGTIGGALQWRILRNQLTRPGGLLLVSIGAWLVAGVAAGAVAFFTGDTIDAAFGSGITGFVAITVTIGLVAGAVGGAIEGAALRRRIGRTR